MAKTAESVLFRSTGVFILMFVFTKFIQEGKTLFT